MRRGENKGRRLPRRHEEGKGLGDKRADRRVASFASGSGSGIDAGTEASAEPRGNSRHDRHEPFRMASVCSGYGGRASVKRPKSGGKAPY